MSAPSPPPRNPGPSWGCHFLRGCDALLPEWVFRPLRWLGTWFAVAAMPVQRAHSRAYLAVALGRPASLGEVFRHFFAFTEFMILRLRVAGNQPHRAEVAPDATGLHALEASKQQALLGTFHVGHSDLIGFLLGRHAGARVFMIRQRVGNSHDTDLLGARFAEWIRFIWVNDPNNLLFALKDAVASGGSVAMKCDRLGFSAKTEAFQFLGARRMFPFTIYHLAIIFRLPVVLCLGVSGGPQLSLVHSTPLFVPDDAGKAANLARARRHFQEFLGRVEALLRRDPYVWFNFEPLNPPVS